MKNKTIKHVATLCATPTVEKATTRPHQMPIYMTSAFSFESIEQGMEIFLKQPGGHVYSRYGNPTIEAVAQRIADLEGFGLETNTHGLLTGSGMAAIHIVLQSFLHPGDIIVTQGNLYGGTTELIKKLFEPQGIINYMIDFSDEEQVRKHISQKNPPKLVLIETPANPTLACIDIAEISRLCKKTNSMLVVDNTFCSPYLQQPLHLGADIVIHSTTKFLHGHGVSTGGAIVSNNKEFIFTKIWPILKLVGSTSNAFDAWLIHLGIKTLAVRMETQSANAYKLAKFLENHSKIRSVNYPMLPSHSSYKIAKKQMKKGGALLSFEADLSYKKTIQLINKMNLYSMAPSLGETDTMILHPASMSHLKVPKETRVKYGITDSLIRVSVGLEHIDDLIGNINEALSRF